MKILKELGQPMLYAGIGLFAAAAKADQLWLYWAAAAVFVAGALLFVAGPFLPGAASSDGGAESWRPSRAHKRPLAGSYSPVSVKNAVPEWIYVVSFVVSVGGMIAFALGPNGISPRTITTLSMVPGGVLFFLAAKAYYGGAVGRRNVARGVAAFFGFLTGLAGIYTWVLAFAGAFDTPDRPFWLGSGAIAMLAGLALTWYGLRYQQSEEGVAIGRELGLGDADSGLFAPDGVYDSKGEVDGVELKFNVEQQEARSGRHGHAPASFRLEVLCGCANPRRARLEIRASGLLGVNLTGLPKLPPLEYWDGYDVMSDTPDLVVGPLQEIRANAAALSSEGGLAELSLEEGAMKAVFSLEGYASTGFVRGALAEVARLAKAFS